MRDKREVLLSMQDVSLDIPIFSKTELSLKKTFYRAVTGSKVSNSKNITKVNALKGINVDIYRGDKVALIGHNGSGKSTFIRLASKIYYPSRGKLISKVEIYPMLSKSFIVSDVLTGIDAAKAHFLIKNRNLNGFDAFLEDIIEFSGLGDFIALPIRTYSEGMASRLMFSLLTSQKYEFLALDEGIGTGDQAFYKKANERLNEFISESGSIILASHSEELLRKFCNRGLVFSCGQLVYDGELEDALKFYGESNN